MKDHVVSLALTFLIFFSMFQVSRAQKPAQPEAKQLAVNGTTIRYWEQGRGVPIVFVHGAYSDHRVWEAQREAVSKGYRFVALDLRYFGTAPWPDDGKHFNVETHADDVAALIRELKAGPVHLVGRSWGSITALAVAIRHPELVRSLFLNEPGIAAAVTDAEERKRMMEDRRCVGPAAAAANAGNHIEAVKLFFECTHNQLGGFAKLPQARQAMLLDNARTVALQVDPARAPQITCEQLRQIKQPTEITIGELTRPFYQITVGAVRRCIPGSRLITIPGATHSPPSQNPSAFNQALLAFLDAHRDSKPQQPNQPVAKQVSVNGATIRYWEQGRGVPVVFVHGVPSDHRYWEGQREAIAKHYRFIALDQRYYGTAPWPDDGAQFSQATHVADLAAFIRELKSGQVFLVGVSGGAGLSLVTAVHHRELVRGLFVHEPGLDAIVTDPADQKVVSESRRDPRGAAVRAAAKVGKMEEAARLFVDGTSGPGSFDALAPELKAMFVDNARTMRLDAPPPVPITCAQLGQLKVPVTISEGQSTRPNRKILAETAHRCIPGSQLLTIPAAGHGAPRQNPSAFNEALLAFLKRN